jgi:anti-sigma regulatory factor (Ser/Thr protein kinase)
MSLTTLLRRDHEGRDVSLLAAQLELLAGVAAGQSLEEALDALLRVVEKVSTAGLLGSVLLLDESGRRLLHGAAPSLPAHYNAAIHNLEIGPSVGSCGTAAYRREQVIVEDIATDPLWAAFRELALGAGLRACWSTPIVGVGGRVLGTFAMYYPAPHRPSATDLALIDVLVRSVSAAITRSRLDEQRERELAEERALGLTFQRSLLPEIPARVGDVELAARYRTGDPGVHVGGDWYDAIEVDDGIVLVVGDVQGHDAQAAAIMGQLRTVVRVTASEGHPPAGILARAGDYLERLRTELLATVLVVHLDPHGRLATVACAGHLPPLVLGVAGGLRAVGTVDLEVGPPLGIGRSWPERSTHLPADAMLLLYTDGLVETRTWDIQEGIGLLGALLETVPADAAPARILDVALGLLPAGNRGDDVAVLAAHLPSSRSSSHRVERSLPPHPMSVPLARSWAEGWLAGHDVPADQRDALLLVVSELVTNAVRQGDGAVTVTLESRSDALSVEVFDTGYRMPALTAADPEATGGRGLHVIDAVAAEWGIREDLRGKSVWARVTRDSPS